jgi:hypothetical protein
MDTGHRLNGEAGNGALLDGSLVPPQDRKQKGEQRGAPNAKMVTDASPIAKKKTRKRDKIKKFFCVG